MILIIYVSVAVACALAAVGNSDKKYNMWVEPKGGEEVVKEVARDVGLTYQGIDGLKDQYEIIREEHPEVDVDDVTRSLNDDRQVLWAKQQLMYKRPMYHFSERDNEVYDDEKEQADLNWFLKTIKDSPDFQNCRTGTFACTEFSPHLLGYLNHLGQTDVTKLGTISTDPAYTTTLSTYQGTTKHLSQDYKKLSAYAVRFSDPNWRKQWYMQDYRTTNYPVMDHNIVPVMFKDLSHLDQDLTGYTVTVGILGDGIKDHPDLGDNYVDSISYNFCTNENGALPISKWTISGNVYDSLGTSSAGIIAMKENNDLCGVGIAPKARVTGLKMTGCDSSVTNVEASALKYNLDSIDIFCNIWTIDDEMGKKLTELSYTVESSLKLGVSEGRNKKGAIYVFPSGANRKSTNCATNGYVNNPYVITIGSASSNGKYATYSERCPAVFAAAYSGDKYSSTEHITSISADGGCADHPVEKPLGPAVASGIIALVLQYKPYLTYRDMMHLIAMTAEVAPLANHRHSWQRNGRGLWVSNDFGFGLLNAKNMIKLAKDWKTVPEKHVCVFNKKFTDPLLFDNLNKKTITFDGTECSVGDKTIRYLEHVELVSTIDYTFRGAVYMNITSPARTNTELLEPRVKDFYRDGIKDWNIMSVQNWGENPHGTWSVIVMACRIKGEENPHGYVHEMTLKLHGTEEMPAHYNLARKYGAFRLPNGDTNMYV